MLLQFFLQGLERVCAVSPSSFQQALLQQQHPLVISPLKVNSRITAGFLRDMVHLLSNGVWLHQVIAN